jgi:hypothetical protein
MKNTGTSNCRLSLLVFNATEPMIHFSRSALISAFRIERGVSAPSLVGLGFGFGFMSFMNEGYEILIDFASVALTTRKTRHRGLHLPGQRGAQICRACKAPEPRFTTIAQAMAWAREQVADIAGLGPDPKRLRSRRSMPEAYCEGAEE